MSHSHFSIVGSCRRLIHIHGRIYLTLYDEEETLKVAQHETTNYVVIPPLKTEADKLSAFSLPSLSEVFKFDEMVRNAARKCASKKLVFSAGCSLFIRVRTTFLIGCHLLVSSDIGFEVLYSALERLHQMFDLASANNDIGSSVSSGLRAISRAKAHDWINFKETFETGQGNASSIAMDEYLHYARSDLIPLLLADLIEEADISFCTSSPVNGSVFTIVPNQILLFLTPSTKIPCGRLWYDTNGKREFSAAFYAELMSFLRVTLIIRLDDEEHQDDDIFEKGGTAVCTLEDLGCRDPADRFSLQTISRFVDVCRHAPGPVAVCGDDRLACTLLTAYLLRAGLFADAAEAVSWICIARGAAVAPDYALLRPRTAGGHTLSREAQSLMEF
jgi:hypothetical protein